jgi:hypothetical protein
MYLSSDLERHTGRFYGKYSGKVTSVTDPDQLGMVKVSVPAIFEEGIEVWARPCFATGHFFVPPIDAMVWVEFEAGDVGYPLWVGTWYPKDTVPPAADKKDAVECVIHTPSGHVIELSDESGKEKVVIRHKIDSVVSIDEKGTILAANQNGSSVTLDADAKQLVLKSEQGQTVTLDDSGIVAVETGGAKLEINGGKVNITAQEVSLKAMTVNVGSSAGHPAVLGDMLKTAFETHMHPTAMGPTGPPLVPLLPTALSNTVKVQA